MDLDWYKIRDRYEYEIDLYRYQIELYIYEIDLYRYERDEYVIDVKYLK